MNIQLDSNGTPIPSYTSDAFDRQRVSTPETVFDAKHIYGFNSIHPGSGGNYTWCYVLSGGAATYNGSSSTVFLTTNTVSGSVARKTGRLNPPYFPGKSHLIQMTGTPDTKIQGTEQRFGALTGNNGVYFGVFSGGQYGIGVRSDVSGTVVDSVVFQNSWNVDHFDGSGKPWNPSRITLSQSASQIFVIDLQMLFVGSVRFGFMIGSDLKLAHISHHANKIRGPYIRESSIPIAYELKNVATLTSTPTIETICSTIISEGGGDIGGPTFTAGNDGTLITGVTSVSRPIFAIRPMATHMGRANRTMLDFDGANFYSEDQSVYFEVRHMSNVTTMDGTWVQVCSGRSTAEYNTTVTSITLGYSHPITCDYVAAGGVGGNKYSTSGAIDVSEIRDPYHIIIKTPNDPSEMFVVYARSISGAAAKCAASITWQELR